MSVSRRGLQLLGAAFVCAALPLVSLAQSQLPISVELHGLAGEALDNARASLGIARLSPEQTHRGGLVRQQHREADAEIRRALEPFGFYRPEIESSLQRTAVGWRAIYTVDPGDQIPLGPIEIVLIGQGGEDPALVDALAAVTLAEGQPLDHREYEAAKQSLSSTATASGYLDARFTEHRVEVDLATYQARVVLHLDTGPRYQVGSINFGESRFDEDYLARYLVLQSGDTFTNQGLAEQRTALSRSGHFQEVNIATGVPTGDEGADIPLNIETVPLKPNRFRGRVGWGTDTDFGLQLDWTRRYIGRHGHQFTAGATAVQDRDSLAGDVSYIIPLQPLQGSAIEIYARHESKDLTFKDVDLDEGGETRISTNLAGGRWHLPVRRVGEFQLESSLGLGLVGEDYDVFEVLFGNLPDSAQDAIIDAIGREAYDTLSPDFEAITLEAHLTFGRADDELYIRHGDQFRLELLGADESLGSNISFWQARFSSWTIRPLGENNRLLARTALGYSDADSSEVLGVNFNDMPEYYEFRAGGARSVRGYGFETIFPSDAITGGKHQLVASLEYEHEFIPDWSGAVFVDAGDAFNDFDDFSERLGVGLGVRWRSPVGVARVDLGFPLNDADDSFQIYITVGPEF